MAAAAAAAAGPWEDESDWLAPLDILDWNEGAEEGSEEAPPAGRVVGAEQISPPHQQLQLLLPQPPTVRGHAGVEGAAGPDEVEAAAVARPKAYVLEAEGPDFFLLDTTAAAAAPVAAGPPSPALLPSTPSFHPQQLQQGQQQQLVAGVDGAWVALGFPLSAPSSSSSSLPPRVMSRLQLMPSPPQQQGQQHHQHHHHQQQQQQQQGQQQQQLVAGGVAGAWVAPGFPPSSSLPPRVISRLQLMPSPQQQQGQQHHQHHQHQHQHQQQQQQPRQQHHHHYHQHQYHHHHHHQQQQQHHHNHHHHHQQHHHQHHQQQQGQGGGSGGAGGGILFSSSSFSSFPAPATACTSSMGRVFTLPTPHASSWGLHRPGLGLEEEEKATAAAMRGISSSSSVVSLISDDGEEEEEGVVDLGFAGPGVDTRGAEAAALVLHCRGGLGWGWGRTDDVRVAASGALVGLLPALRPGFMDRYEVRGRRLARAAWGCVWVWVFLGGRTAGGGGAGWHTLPSRPSQQQPPPQQQQPPPTPPPQPQPQPQPQEPTAHTRPCFARANLAGLSPQEKFERKRVRNAAYAMHTRQRRRAARLALRRDAGVMEVGACVRACEGRGAAVFVVLRRDAGVMEVRASARGGGLQCGWWGVVGCWRWGGRSCVGKGLAPL